MKRRPAKRTQKHIKGGRPEMGLTLSAELKEIIDAIAIQSKSSKALVINMALNDYFGIRQ